MEYLIEATRSDWIHQSISQLSVQLHHATAFLISAKSAQPGQYPHHICINNCHTLIAPN